MKNLYWLSIAFGLVVAGFFLAVRPLALCQAPKPGQRYREIEKQFPTASRPGNAGNVKVGKRGRG